MFGSVSRVLSTGLVVILMAGCSPAPEQSSSSDAKNTNLMQLPMTFDWEAPARLNVRETARIEGKDIKIKYDVMVEKYDELEGHLLLSFANVTPIEFDGEQTNMSVYPDEIRRKMKSILVAYYTRPSLIVNPEGRIVGFANIDKSIRTLVDISQQADVETQQLTYEALIGDPSTNTRIQSSADSVWSCLVRPWLDFSTPLNKRSEQSVLLAIVEGAEPVPATRSEENFGFVESAGSTVELETVTVSSGVELARAMQQQAQLMAGGSTELPNIEGIATATNWCSAKAKLDPATLRPKWARCATEFSIDSTDASVLQPANLSRTTEFEIQWL